MYAPLTRESPDVKLVVLCERCLELRPRHGDCVYCRECQRELAEDWPDEE
jgi:hypothetical protein